MVMRRLSKKSYKTNSTRDPLKYCNQMGGNCPNKNFIESTKEDSRYPKGKRREAG